MNTLRKPSPAAKVLECLLLACSAGLLLRATWLPTFQIKGFGDFDLESVGMWATHAARYTLITAILCLPLRPLGISRWWMALSVGILFGPLASLVGQAIDLTKSPGADIPVNIKDVIVTRTGAWVCAAGLACWVFDLLVALYGRVRCWCRGCGSKVQSDAEATSNK